MKLNKLFPSLGSADASQGADLLIEKANAFDDFSRFQAAVVGSTGNWAMENLLEAARHATVGHPQKAQPATGFPSANWPPAPVVFSGQQAYVDYSLGVAAKVGALQALEESCHTFFGWADYDFFGSDLFISQIRIPTAFENAASAVLSARLYSGFKHHRRKDMRFVAPPDQHTLDKGINRIRDAVVHALRFLRQKIPYAERLRVLERLDRLHKGLESARLNARNAAEFNMLWSTDLFHKMGYGVLFCAISKLLDHPALAARVADTLSRAIRNNRLFVESINEILLSADAYDLCLRCKPEGYVPAYMTDPQTGTRLALTLQKKGGDHYLGAVGSSEFRVNIGKAHRDEVMLFLKRYTGLWSPSVFLPLYLYRCGLQGIVSGKSSIRYSVVIGNVLEKVFGESHPPSLLCMGSLSGAGPLHAAAEASRGQLPKELTDFEPTLFYKLLFADMSTVRGGIDEQLDAHLRAAIG